MQLGWRCGLSLSGGARASQPSAGGAWTITLVQGEGSSDLMQSCKQLWFIINLAQALGPGHTTAMPNAFPEAGLLLAKRYCARHTAHLHL